MQPLYTSANCSPAYELRWSLAIFATSALPPAESWVEQLQTVVERDNVRLLEHRHPSPNTWQFLLSTKPHVAPPVIVKSVKGRLQHLLQASHPNAFRRNFSLTSVGDVRREVVEAYVANQLGHHRLADPRAQERLAKYQLAFPEVDLSQPMFSSHGRYVYNLHVALVHDSRWCDVDEGRLNTTRDTVIKAAAKKQHRLSRVALLADHLHLTLGGNERESPEEIALSYLNNLAFAHGMAPLYRYSYYVGTFGEYDLGAIRRSL
jgi:REP element-mobilizing transposase RayT